MNYGTKNNIDSNVPDQMDKLMSDLSGWLGCKQKEVTNIDNSLVLYVHVDETCELYIDGQKFRKIKSGKVAQITHLYPGKSYSLKLVSLAQRDSIVDLVYECPVGELLSDDLEVSFAETRKKNKEKVEHLKSLKLQEQESVYCKEGMLKQIIGNYDDADQMQSGMIAVFLDKKVGYLNEDGFEVVPCEYEDGCNFDGEYATVCKGGKWGIIDKIGQIVVPFFSDCPCVSKDAFEFFICKCNDSYAISTIKEGVPHKFLYEDIKCISGQRNLFAVKQGDMWNIIDATGGNSPFSMQIKSIEGTFTNRYRSFYSNWEGWGQFKLDFPLAVQHINNDRWGYLNSNMKLTVPFIDEYSGHDTGFTQLKIIKVNGKMGLVNVDNGKYILPPNYDIIKETSPCSGYFKIVDNAVVPLDISHFAPQGGIQGVVDMNGNIIVPQIFQWIDCYEDSEPPRFSAFKFADYKSWENYSKEKSEVYLYSVNGVLLAKGLYNDHLKLIKSISENRS